MKKLLVLAGVCCIGLSVATAQTPIPDPDSMRDPIKQGDPAPQIIPPQASYRKAMIKVKPSEVPAPIKKKLEHSAYKGWQKATIYRNTASSVYLVEFQEANKTRLYKFDKHGQLLEDEDDL